MPAYRYLVSKKGKVEVGILACAMCHTRVMPDGTFVKGAQGDFPLDRAMAYDYREAGKIEETRIFEFFLYASPGDDPRSGNRFAGCLLMKSRPHTRLFYPG
jgi:hypothetical protein